MTNSWNNLWFDLADSIRSKSKCSRRKIGAVLVSEDNKHLIALGYNGAPPGFPEALGASCEVFCPRAKEGGGTSYSNCVSVHAECAAILEGGKSKYPGAIIYVTSTMCWDCAKIVVAAGITKVVMRVNWIEDAHRDPKRTIDFLNQCGVTVVSIEVE